MHNSFVPQTAGVHAAQPAAVPQLPPMSAAASDGMAAVNTSRKGAEILPEADAPAKDDAAKLGAGQEPVTQPVTPAASEAPRLQGEPLTAALVLRTACQTCRMSDFFHEGHDKHRW